MAVLSKAKKQNKKIIYHAHSTEEDFKNSYVLSNQIAPLFKRHLVSLYRQADAIITPTPYAKQLLINYGLDLPIYPLSNGIDLSRYQYDEDKIKAFRKYFHLKEEQKVIIGVGLYLHRKGIHDFIEVAKHFPDVKFIWFGHSPSISIPSSLRLVIDNHPSNVILPGYVKGAIIEGAFMNSDLFFFPSYEETEGIVVLEALAAHCRVLVRDIGVYEDWLEHGVSCFKGNDNPSFIKIIELLIKNELKDTTLEGYKIAQARSLDKIGLALKDIYEMTLGDLR
jgi:1,2-diacylglycerol-3-alpha-glucose alpha-1,2-glucosyltransferase